MELVKDVVVDFCLFSLIEGFIYCYFFNVIGRLGKFKIKEILILSIGNCLISQIFPPVFYQIITILWMGVLLNKFKKIKLIDGIKFGFYVMIYQLIIEMIVAMFYEIIFKINFSTMKKFYLFLIMIPVRIIEIILIIFYKNNKRRCLYERLDGRSA